MFASLFVLQKPFIIDFQPKIGPLAGGTLVNVSIGNFENRQLFLVKVAKLQVDKTTFRL